MARGLFRTLGLGVGPTWVSIEAHPVLKPHSKAVEPGKVLYPAQASVSSSVKWGQLMTPTSQGRLEDSVQLRSGGWCLTHRWQGSYASCNVTTWLWCGSETVVSMI